jgi:hypothetical protein
MANKDGHRRFGNVRQRASGRWQARYPGPDGRLRSATQTFARKSDAERYLVMVKGQLARGEWIDSERGKVLLDDYAARWIMARDLAETLDARHPRRADHGSDLGWCGWSG